MLKEKSLKRISVLLLLLFVNQIFFPTVAFAVTGGPGQPELESFTPFNSSDMVDPFSGDFKYNIPLLNVPGPNGGYPINIGYSGNISTEQEAGWVGLGWSLNPGAINRQLRGLPDDFDGSQEVVRERKMKPNRTFTLGVGSAFSEVFGFDLSKVKDDLMLQASLNLTVNNYSGFNMGVGLGFAKVENKNTEPSGGVGDAPANREYTPLSFAMKTLSYLNKSRLPQIKDIISKKAGRALRDGLNNVAHNIPSSAFFAGSGSALSQIDFPRNSNSFTFDGKLGIDKVGTTTDLEFTLFYTQQNYSESSISYPAFGYMHSAEGSENNKAILDFYTDKNSSLGPNSAFLPVPVLTNDVFSVTSQGVGGVYRAQLGSIPILTTPIVESSTNSFGFGLDLAGSTTAIKTGFNPKASFTTSYSGKWSGGDAISYLFGGDATMTDKEKATFERSSFIKLGDITDNRWHNSAVLQKAEALRFDLKNDYQKKGKKWTPKVINQLYPKSGSSFGLTSENLVRKDRPARSNLFKYFTTSQLEEIIGNTETHRQIGLTSADLTGNGNEISVSSEINQPLPQGEKDASLIHQIEIENNGVEYIYGIPAFTHSKVDKTFSIDPPTDFGAIRGNVDVNEKEDTDQNESGRGALYNSNTINGFAHAYLLTEIYSNDYVDITDNGPSEDDFGSYTKFDYLRLYNDFVSRSPAQATSQTVGSYVPGINSDEDDDMATYSESKKDIYYLRKVETKTHYAEFQLAVRGDDFSHNPISSVDQKLAKLQKITLYKKNGTDPATEIKSVEFEYNDDESSAGLMQGATATTDGKLTLKRIRFTFEGQKTDTYLNPFEFDYYNSNVNFSEGDTDKWGQYQPDEYNDFNNNFLYPYVAQYRDLDADGLVDSDDSDLRNSWASAWRLKTIGLPTGGEVEIKYESDDYGYVQNKKAQDMYQIKGIGEVGEFSLTSNKIYFKLKENVVSGSASLKLKQQLEEDLKNVYFKALVELKNKPAQYNAHGAFLEEGKVKEFVEGYLNFTSIGFDESCEIVDGIYQYAFVQVENASGDKNPIRLAAANYLRLNGAQLNSSININFTGRKSVGDYYDIANTIVTSAMSNKDMNRNFVETILGPSKNYCYELATNFPSIIRLNAQNDQKFGGGSRVSEIVIKDNWDLMQGSESTFNMKQVFTYQNKDGSTSGVAEYEPLIGGEENPLRQPHYYSSERAFFKDNALLFELPATEALFPSPRVGYSRVVVENIPINTDGSTINDYTLSSNGIVEHEFYTSKEYPLRSSATNPKKINLSDLTEVAKWFGGKNFFQPGFSQGYYTELNDMHGRQKRISTYSSTLGTDEAPFQSTSYYYKTMNGYTEEATNYLDNSVEVLTNDGAVETKTMGQISDGWVEMAESNTITRGGDIKTNFEFISIAGVSILIPTAIPGIDYSHRMRRTVVLNKLVSKTAILEKVVTQQEGRMTTVNNLLFDYENGQPLLTQILNDFDKPIYSYNRPEHWVNSNFKHPWRNWGANVSNSHWKGIIQNGDLILRTNGTKYWVEEAENGVLKDESGTSLTISAGSFEGTIIQSGYTGRSGAMSSQIVSLTDPSALGNREFDLFTSYSDKANWLTDVQNDLNEGSLSSATQYYNCDENPLEDCSNPSATFCPTIETESNALRFRDPTKSATDFASLVFPSEYEDEMGDFTLEKIGNLVRATNGTVVLILNWEDPHNLFPECMPGVLEAGVTLYDHDVKNHEVLENGNYSLAQADIDNNPTRYKDWYDYKTVQSLKNVNQRGYTDDNSTDGYFGTHLDEDGTYDLFVDYNFGAVPDNNTEWVNQGKIVDYDPFGNTLEIENAIGISSSEMFNEDHSLVTATAVNAIYKEIGYQNFENLSGTWSGKQGHIDFDDGAYPTIKTSSAHTGNHSLNVTSNTKLKLVDLEFGKKYRLSFWQQTGTSVLTTGANCTLDAENIDGWDLITYIFSPTSSGTAIITFNTTGVIDDLRFYPSDAAIKTFVYDLNTYRLIAQLDANNFATFYGYNEEGTLSQVKKETNRGIQTISNNVVHRQK